MIHNQNGGEADEARELLYGLQPSDQIIIWLLEIMLQQTTDSPFLSLCLRFLKNNLNFFANQMSDEAREFLKDNILNVYNILSNDVSIDICILIITLFAFMENQKWTILKRYLVDVDNIKFYKLISNVFYKIYNQEEFFDLYKSHFVIRIQRDIASVETESLLHILYFLTQSSIYLKDNTILDQFNEILPEKCCSLLYIFDAPLYKNVFAFFNHCYTYCGFPTIKTLTSSDVFNNLSEEKRLVFIEEINIFTRIHKLSDANVYPVFLESVFRTLCECIDPQTLEIPLPAKSIVHIMRACGFQCCSSFIELFSSNLDNVPLLIFSIDAITMAFGCYSQYMPLMIELLSNGSSIVRQHSIYVMENMIQNNYPYFDAKKVVNVILQVFNSSLDDLFNIDESTDHNMSTYASCILSLFLLNDVTPDTDILRIYTEVFEKLFRFRLTLTLSKFVEVLPRLAEVDESIFSCDSTFVSSFDSIINNNDIAFRGAAYHMYIIFLKCGDQYFNEKNDCILDTVAMDLQNGSNLFSVFCVINSISFTFRNDPNVIGRINSLIPSIVNVLNFTERFNESDVIQHIDFLRNCVFVYHTTHSQELFLCMSDVIMKLLSNDSLYYTESIIDFLKEFLPNYKGPLFNALKAQALKSSEIYVETTPVLFAILTYLYQEDPFQIDLPADPFEYAINVAHDLKREKKGKKKYYNYILNFIYLLLSFEINQKRIDGIMHVLTCLKFHKNTNFVSFLLNLYRFAISEGFPVEDPSIYFETILTSLRSDNPDGAIGLTAVCLSGNFSCFIENFDAIVQVTKSNLYEILEKDQLTEYCYSLYLPLVNAICAIKNDAIDMSSFVLKQNNIQDDDDQR